MGRNTLEYIDGFRSGKELIEDLHFNVNDLNDLWLKLNIERLDFESSYTRAYRANENVEYYVTEAREFSRREAVVKEALKIMEE